MYWVRKIEDEVSTEVKYFGYSDIYLLCDSFEEFGEDTAGVLGALIRCEAYVGELSRAEAREKAKKSAPLILIL
ncbi:hypothetical protein FACS1894190_02480 [Spirochaetia bacterium]|nr:hypothetical protein FACS1894190_02480 [Spirochaetia bacterium]